MKTTHEQLINNLSYLKLNEMSNHLGEVIDFVNTNRLTFEEGLLKLSDYEINYKQKMIINAMVKTGAFPHFKGLDDFDFNYQESLNKGQIIGYGTLKLIRKCLKGH